MLATFIAATVPVEKAGDVNPLLEAAKSIGDPEKNDNSDSTSTESAPVDNGTGSFERFMASFGSPNRWAGR